MLNIIVTSEKELLILVFCGYFKVEIKSNNWIKKESIRKNLCGKGKKKESVVLYG